MGLTSSCKKKTVVLHEASQADTRRTSSPALQSVRRVSRNSHVHAITRSTVTSRTTPPRTSHLPPVGVIPEQYHTSAPASSQVGYYPSSNSELVPKLEKEKRTVDDLREKVSSLQEKNARLEDEKRRVYAEQRKTEKKLQGQIKDLTDRLSAEMGKKITSDESALENISIKNRPMNIADDYQNFCSNEWLNAKEYLDKKTVKSEEEKVQLLCDIILEAETAAADIYTAAMASTEEHLRNLPIFDPVGFYKKTPTQASDKKSCGESPLDFDLPLELTNVVRDIMRKQAFDAEKNNMIKVLRKTTRIKRPLWQDLRMKKTLSPYLAKCCELAWSMKLQSPQMKFHCQGLGASWKKNQQEVYFESDDPANPANKVACYVHPALYHGSKLMVKGNVYIRKGYRPEQDSSTE